MRPAAGPESVLTHDDTRSTVQCTQTGAACDAEKIREIVELEREQMAHERMELASERERMMEELRQERVRLDEERQARIRELAIMKADFESDRALKASEEADQRERERMEDSEWREGILAQLNDIIKRSGTSVLGRRG